MLFAASAIGLAILGTIIYGINTIQVEKKENKTSAWPWLIFALLGLNFLFLFVKEFRLFFFRKTYYIWGFFALTDRI
ncbi:hypothetical protein LR010_01380 [Candidatus Gracilibacteria bacterium]|nr:hypothetical protein [Candidatus Gracilibacteria bacterium]